MERKFEHIVAFTEKEFNSKYEEALKRIGNYHIESSHYSVKAGATYTIFSVLITYIVIAE